MTLSTTSALGILLLAQQASARAIWRSKRSTIHIEKRSVASDMPTYMWIIIAFASATLLLVFGGAAFLRWRNRRRPPREVVEVLVPRMQAPLPAQTLVAPNALSTAPTYPPYSPPYNPDEPEQVPPYTRGGYTTPEKKDSTEDLSSPLGTVPVLTREGGMEMRPRAVV